MPSFRDQEIKSTGKFLKIESGHPTSIRLLEEGPEEKILHGFGKDATSCTGEGCFKCMEGSEVKQRFSINVYSHEIRKVMLWEFGASICKQLKSIDKTLNAQEMKITDVDLMVEATGSNMAKKYQVQPMLKSKPVPEGLVLHKHSDNGLSF